MPTHMIPPDPNTAIMQNGADTASKDFGVSVKFRGPEQFSIPAVQQIFDASIAAKPTGIAATLPDANALGPKIEEAVSRGIPVVLFNAGLDQYKKLGALTYVGQTELLAGQEAGKRLAAIGVRDAIVVNHQQGQLTLETRYQGVKEGLGNGAKVKEFAVDGTNPTAIRNGVASAIKQNPGVQALVTLGPGAAEQALKAIQDAGKLGSVKLATFDISPAVLQAVQARHMLFAIDQQMFFQTYMAVMSLVTYAQWRIGPVAAVPSGPLFVDAKSAGTILNLSAKGIH
jgi:simple sugar transport system substrate-binding protein